MEPRIKVSLVLQGSVVVSALAAIVVIVIEMFLGSHSKASSIFVALACVVLMCAAVTRFVQLLKLTKNGRHDP